PKVDTVGGNGGAARDSRGGHLACSGLAALGVSARVTKAISLGQELGELEHALRAALVLAEALRDERLEADQHAAAPAALAGVLSVTFTSAASMRWSSRAAISQRSAASSCVQRRAARKRRRFSPRTPCSPTYMGLSY